MVLNNNNGKNAVKRDEQDRLAKLALREKLGYGIGDGGFNFYWVIIGSYLSFFYTDVFGLSAAAAGTLFLVTRIFDAFTDPVMGAIADRTESRWGKFRPYLLFGALPLMGASVLTLTTPNLDMGGKTVWAYGTYTLMMLCYTIVSTPYSSLAGVITADSQQRNALFSIRFFFAYSVGTIVGLFTPVLAANFALGGDVAKGWQITMLLYAAIASVLFWITFFSTRERIAPPPAQKTKPLHDIRDLLANRPWLILFALAMIIMMTLVFRGSSATYYFKYFVERPDLMGPYIGVQMASYALGCLALPFLTRIITDKARLLIILMSIVGVLSVVFCFVPKPERVGVVTLAADAELYLSASELLGDKADPVESEVLHWFEHKPYLKLFVKRQPIAVEHGPRLFVRDGKSGQSFSVIKIKKDGSTLDSADLPLEILIMFILNAAISLALGPKSPLTWSMYADAADFNEWKTGRRATAMTFSAATFSQKLGAALGSAGVLWVLALVGYSANEVQVGASIKSIVWLQTLVPAFFAFIAVAVLRFYDLNSAKLERIQIELNNRELGPL